MSPARPDRATAQRALQRGFTMIEVLITFVILAIGLLGIVSLMTMSKTSQYEALQRARAVALADSMLERIRNNPAALNTYSARDADSPVGQGQIAGNTPPNDCTTSTPCTPQQLAQNDLWVWEEQLDGERVTVTDGGATTAQLKAARGCIVDFTPYDGRLRTGNITVLVQWEGLQATVDGVSGTDTVCGNGDAGSNPRRRQVVVNSFVVDRDEF